MLYDAERRCTVNLAWVANKLFDLSSQDHRINSGPKASKAEGEDASFAQEEEGEKSQNIIKMKHLCQSSIIASHKNFVGDLAFIPNTIKMNVSMTINYICSIYNSSNFNRCFVFIIIS